MKLLRVVVVAAVLIFRCGFCKTTADEEDFGCKNSSLASYNGDLEITYCCQDYEDLNPWRIAGSDPVSVLTVESCDDLKISFACGSGAAKIKSLRFRILNNVQIVPTENSCYPESITFEVVNIDTIPSNAFSGPQLKSLNFESSNINKIQPHAIAGLPDLKSFKLKSSMVKEIRRDAIQLSCNDCNFEVRSNNIDYMDHSAFQIDVPEAVFASNALTTIPSDAIRGSVNSFEFRANSVTLIHKNAFSFSAADVNIEANFFANVHSGAFAKIVPGNYSFSVNSIKYANPQGLNPSMAAYKSAQGGVSVDDNNIQCTCVNFGNRFCDDSQFIKEEEICDDNVKGV